jgi:hypothetical protein
MRIAAFGVASLLAAGLIVGNTVHATDSHDEPAYSDVLAAMNAQLRAAGITHVSIAKAELLVAGSMYGQQATTLIASDRTHLFPVQFVEDDPRRSSPPNTLTYLVDQSDGSALSWVTVPGGAITTLPNAVTEPEIDASMAVWRARPCNGPSLQKVPDGGADPDLADGIFLQNLGLIGTPFADVTHAGWLPSAFFNALVPQGATFILGVTLSFTFIDDDGNEKDIDRDGYSDVAFAEIYYNRSFPWGTGGNNSNVDIQSVVIHEAGHALGLAHFGKVFIKNNDTLQFAPKAIMNAVYVSQDRRVLGTDNASFCQAWARSH